MVGGVAGGGEWWWGVVVGYAMYGRWMGRVEGECGRGVVGRVVGEVYLLIY